MAGISRITLPNNQTYELRDNRLDNNNYIIDDNYIHTDNNYTTTEKNKLNNIASGAEVNQNAFTTVKVGTTNLIADAKSDTLTITAGDNITLTPTANSDSFTIAATDTKYTAATTAPGKVASASSVGTSTNYARQDHTHGIDLATGDSNGQVKIAGTNVSVKGLGTAAYTASTAYLAAELKGAASGVAQLDSNGLVPSTQLPSYVDDVIEYNGRSSFPATGQTGKIYVDTSANITYRWSGTTYVQIGSSLALGTTSSTAFRGDYGNIAYQHATDSSRLTTATNSGLYKVASTAQGHIASLTAVTKEDITALGIPGEDTNTIYSATVKTITPVTKKTVVTGGTTTNITPVTSKTVVTSATFNDVVIGGQTTDITPVSSKTVVTSATFNDVVTGGSTTSITPVTKKTVVTSASGATATVINGVLTLTDGNFGTGDSVTTGTAVNAYTSLTTGASGSATTGASVTSGTKVAAYTSLTTGASGSATTGASVTSGTTVAAYTGLTTGDSVTEGTAISVVTGITAS